MDDASLSELERLRAEVHRLRDSERRYQSVIAAMSEGIVVQTGTGEIIACNPAAERILGLTADQMSGRTSLDPRWRAIHEDGSPFPGETHPAMETLRTGLPCRNVVMGVHRPEGTLSWIEINTEPIPGADPDSPKVVCTFNDITELRRVLDDLKATDERLDLALRAARMGAWQLEVAERRMIWSDALDELFGIPPGSFDGTFEHYLRLVHADDRARVNAEVEAALADPGHHEFYVRHRIVADGGQRWVDGHARIFRDAQGRATRMAGVVVDVTTMRRLELEVRQAQRLEAIGRLAGGIAHDVNNVLTVIGSAVALASSPGRDPRGEHDLIRDAVERAARLTGQLLAFARRQPPGVTVLDLGALVVELRPLLTHLLGEHIELVVDVAPGAWTIRADHGQIEQVIVNLIANARDAIGQAGRVGVSVGRPAGEGDAVALVIEDDGAGMPPEVLEHVFEPFFSTREGGTGLGLATCFGIVEQAGGRIDLRSAVGAGTRVEVRLPWCAQPPTAPVEHAAPEVVGGGETLLLVEDDPAIRLLLERVLSERGYRVLVARDGIEGLVVAGQHLDEIALVISDVVMPRLGGPELIRRLRGIRPDLPAVLMSGYASESVVVPDDVVRLDKPFAPDAMLRHVRRLIDGGAKR